MNSRLLLFLLGVSLLLYGCIEGEAEPTPFPTPVLTPTPSPTANATATPTPVIEVTLTPTATLAPETVLACGNTGEGQCVSGAAPLYCLNGLKVDNCAKCGCPTGQVCGRISDFSTYKCWSQEFIEKNNGTILKVVSPTPSPNVTTTPSPTPTIGPTIAPLPSPYPDFNTFKLQMQTALKNATGIQMYFQGTNQPGTYQILHLNTPQLNFYLYDGVYSGWTSFEEDQVSRLNATQRFNYVLLLNETDSQPPSEFRFKMECYKWSYSVDVTYKENIVTNYNKDGLKIAQAVASICR
ncbi:hypothetical protein HUU53_03810 [Candidatus Micrarchaeota archaeon]|nr:hypothetical protein [Candidatus Micrarchaeota archaeon]